MATQRRYRFGVIQETMGSREAWVTQARRVEDAGYATFLIRDHFVPDFFGDQFAPIPALMTAANVTQTLRVGTLVLDNDYRHPVMLAKEAATLDLLSDGRFELGLGAGWLQGEYEQAGLPFERPGLRISRLEESIRVLKGLFADEPLNVAGNHYTITGLNGFPKPAQRPHPPLLIGGGGKRMLQLAGREANIVGILNSSVAQGTISNDPAQYVPDVVAEKVAWVRQGAGERFDEVELSMVISVVVTDQRRASAEQFIHDSGWDGVSVEQIVTMPSIFIGSVDQIVEDMQQRREQFGFSYYVVADADMASFAPVVARLKGL